MDREKSRVRDHSYCTVTPKLHRALNRPMNDEFGARHGACLDRAAEVADGRIGLLDH
jgi:hypothetical protein